MKIVRCSVCGYNIGCRLCKDFFVSCKDCKVLVHNPICKPNVDIDYEFTVCDKCKNNEIKRKELDDVY